MIHSPSRRHSLVVLPSRSRGGTTDQRSMYGPRSTKAAGRSVNAASTDTHTTREPPMPAHRVSRIGLNNRPKNPIITVTPDQAMVCPARATVSATASAMLDRDPFSR